MNQNKDDVHSHGPTASTVEMSGPSASDVEQCAIQLASLTERVLTFMSQQFDRLADASRIGIKGSTSDGDEEQLAELKQKQHEWEQQKALESRRIEEETRMLTEAWDRVEQERRDLLTSNRVNDPIESQTPAPPTRELSDPSLSDTNIFDVGMPYSTQSAAVQFQQIKREIRQHARRRR